MIAPVSYGSFKELMQSTVFSKEIMLSYLNTGQKQVDDAIALALSNEQPYAWRSAWILGHYLDNNDIRLQPFQNQLIDSILSAAPDGYQRELLRLAAMCGINDSNAGEIANICFSIWEQPRKQSSVRLMAFKILMKISDSHPEMKPELLLLTETYSDTLSPGIQHSLSLLQKQIKKEIKNNAK